MPTFFYTQGIGLSDRACRAGACLAGTCHAGACHADGTAGFVSRGTCLAGGLGLPCRGLPRGWPGREHKRYFPFGWVISMVSRRTSSSIGRIESVCSPAARSSAV